MMINPGDFFYPSSSSPHSFSPSRPLNLLQINNAAQGTVLTTGKPLRLSWIENCVSMGAASINDSNSAAAGSLAVSPVMTVLVGAAVVVYQLL
ncbi:MAG: hypothetical protein J3R72DRAFT_486261 [Linnemannia gamsii]|nr:MAG: hypothetical protein J3R72DRAFT_486261 [Linnemannia gamsii]